MDFESFENFVTGTHTQFKVVMDFKVRYSEASYKLEVGSGITASFNWHVFMYSMHSSLSSPRLFMAYDSW